ncbi:MAG: hypothetical protein IPM57_02965 [Oligoflexia bacterium]|nr:hypothetical protein [Oligoflexia bacterium]
MIKYFITFILLFSSISHGGLESTSTLPKGVVSPEISFGIINGLSEKFNSNGDVIDVTSDFHINLMGEQIAKLDARAGELVSFLNTFNLGSQLSLGTIDFKANPTISYTIINPAYGIKENLAVGFGFPIIHFKNEMEIVTGGTNSISSIQSHIGGLNPEVQSGLQQMANMAANLPLTVQSAIIAKGYKPISSMEYSSIGDFQVYARWRFYESQDFKVALRPYLLFPTGRGDDPDDLADYAVGGYSALGTYLTSEYTFLNRFVLSFILQYQVHIPDRVDKRVPASVDDILPGIEQKENVQRFTGSLYDVVIAPRYKFSRWFSGGVFYDFSVKDPDTYSGNKNFNYGLLSRDSGNESHKIGAYMEFSTTDFYFSKEFPFPFIIGYSITDMVNAKNNPNITNHVFNLRMFF